MNLAGNCYETLMKTTSKIWESKGEMHHSLVFLQNPTDKHMLLCPLRPADVILEMQEPSKHVHALSKSS